MTVSLAGNLVDTSLPDVIEALHQQRASGTLTIGTGGSEKTLCIKDGHIIFASSKNENDRLGEVLVRSGKITRAQLERGLKLHKNSAGLKNIGAIFVENGFLSPKDLFNGLKLQVRSIIHGLFRLTEGPYRFEEVLPSNVIPLQIDMEEILREIIQQMKQEIE